MIKLIVLIVLALCLSVSAADFSLPITVDDTTYKLLRVRWGTGGALATPQVTMTKASEACGNVLDGLARESLKKLTDQVHTGYERGNAAKKQAIMDGLEALR